MGDKIWQRRQVRVEFWEPMSEQDGGCGILPAREEMREGTATPVHATRVGVHVLDNITVSCNMHERA